MRTIRHDGSGLVLESNAPPPDLAPGEALIRPLRVGISGADIRVASGDIKFKGVLGHEFVGVVEDVHIPADAPPMLRSKVQLKGERVVGSPSIVCQTCEMCRNGLSAHCRNRAVIGLYKADGCFADRFALPLVNLHPVPEGVDDDRAALALPLARALHAARLVRVDSRQFVTVLGDSLLALLTAQALTLLNTSVRLLGHRPERIALCDRWGVKHRPIEDAGRRQDQDVVIDCTGSASGLRLATQLARPKGTVVLMSDTPMPFPPGVPLPDHPPPQWRQPIDMAPVVSNELTLLGARDGALPDALGLLETDRMEVVSLITRSIPLDEGIAALSEHPEAQIKLLMTV